MRQRVVKEAAGGTTNFRWRDNKNLIQETDESDDLTKSYTTTEDEYGDLISEYDLGADGGPTEFYQQFDAQHAANAMIDESGSIAQQFKFQALASRRLTPTPLMARCRVG